jgi:hypothetical protein
MASLTKNGGPDDGIEGSTASHAKNGIIGLNNDTTARNAATAGGNGVFGFTQVPDGAGVFGANASTGIGVAGLGLIGVSGGSVNGFGVVGVSAPTGAKGGDGVQGITNSELRNGVYGLNVSKAKRGNNDPAGNGVFGYTNVPDGAGILGAHASAGTGVVGTGWHGVDGTGAMGVVGTGTSIGLWGIANGGWAGYFSGPIMCTADVTVAGNITLNSSGDVILADCAEPFEVADAEAGPGTVMIISADGKLQACERPYDKTVAGVVSGAGNFRPGLVLGKTPTGKSELLIALLGKVYCKVDARHSPVEVGDLLTTSHTPGHAMKADDSAKAFGCVIGKALSPLNEGQGLIPILIALQ